MKRIIRKILLALTSVAVAVSTGWAAESITVAGTGASQEILREIAARFMKDNPGITVQIPDSVGSGGGVKAAGQGTADLGRVARNLKEKEKGYGLEYRAFARIPIVFVAHPDVTATDITSAQSRDVYAGAITNWEALGGQDLRIRVVSRYEGDTTIKKIRKHIPGWKDLVITKRSKASNTDQENVELIKTTPGAIGFMNLLQARHYGLRILRLDGMNPEDPAYPLAIELAIVYKPETFSGARKAFVEYLSGKTAREIIAKRGAVPVGK